MGALTFHEQHYPSEFPSGALRSFEVTTFDGKVELRIGAIDGERMNNGRVGVALTKTQAAALINDLQRAADYVFGG